MNRQHPLQVSTHNVVSYSFILSVDVTSYQSFAHFVVFSIDSTLTKGEWYVVRTLYLGFLIVIGGLIYGAILLHVPVQWIVVGSVVLLGMAILKGVKATRQKDSST